ncbi:nucleoside diphosphate kinase regulator [uncultured Parasphingorhabdus sp.]|uniref:nucleoside diphosphate kinase regulator n=1 Tax=uncultured Parasphingorhabdus sp. TaxID=2709694 RepID=UPI0030D7844D|tara:strand:+ start:7765 stop:8199 length:435 start_codon:yes stop_codon:yes gene_type:complete
MKNTNISPGAMRPVIHMIDHESDAIEAFAMALEARNPKVAEMLYEELGRATLHSVDDMPDNIVTMNCTVEFIDETSGLRRMVKLVYPKDSDIENDCLSILTPMGAGLIGMVAGETIAWPDRSGTERMLRIVAVTPPDHPNGSPD